MIQRVGRLVKEEYQKTRDQLRRKGCAVMHEEESLRHEVRAALHGEGHEMKAPKRVPAYSMYVQLEHAARMVWGPASCSCMPCVLAACTKAQELVSVDPDYLSAAVSR